MYKAKNEKNEWVYGNLLLSTDVDKEFKAIIIPMINSGMFQQNNDKELGFETYYIVKKETICEFTGKFDDFERELYENDIILIKYLDDGLECEEVKIISKDEVGKGFSPLNWEHYCENCDSELLFQEIMKLGNKFDDNYDELCKKYKGE